MAPRTRLGERLLERGVITEGQLADGLRAQQVTGEELGHALRRLGYVGEDDLMRLLCDDADIPFLELEDARPQASAVRVIPEALARAHSVLPLEQEDGRIRVALVNPFDIGAVTALERVTGRPLTVVAGPRERITALLETVYDRGSGGGEGGKTPGGSAPGVGTATASPDARSSSGSQEQVVAQARPAPPARPRPAPRPKPAVRPAPRDRRLAPPSGRAGVLPDGGAGDERLALRVIERGVALGATAIHVEPRPDALGVRYRVDGQLQDGGTVPAGASATLVGQLRELAGLDAEGPLPQEGRFRVEAEGRPVDLRIATFPTLHGEDLTLRVVDRSRVQLALDGLGPSPADLKLIRESLTRPHGLVLVTGPTGAGKTTTLYSALHELDRSRQSVVTLEDPVAYELDGVRQAQVDVARGLTYATGLRSLLRHDPDVLLVGELRDRETVELSVGAALTGHLVLTTVHTRSAARAIPRLLDMGAEPYVLASALELVVAQRLVRLLCQECKEPVEVPDPVRQRYGLGEAEVYRARGCSACRQTGYRGRIGLFELLPVTEAVEEVVYRGGSAEEIRRAAADRPTLLRDGIRKVVAGVTSLEEVVKAAGV